MSPVPKTYFLTGYVSNSIRDIDIKKLLIILDIKSESQYICDWLEP